MLEWKETEKIINEWIIEITQTLESFEKIVELKTEEVQWNGPETEIDSVEILKAKVISGRQYNQIFLD